MTESMIEKLSKRQWARIETNDAMLEAWVAKDEGDGPFKVVFSYAETGRPDRPQLLAHFSGTSEDAGDLMLRGPDAEGFYRRISGKTDLPKLEAEAWVEPPR